MDQMALFERVSEVLAAPPSQSSTRAVRRLRNAKNASLQVDMFDVFLDAMLTEEQRQDQSLSRLDSDNYVEVADALLVYSIVEATGASRGSNHRKPSEDAWSWILADPRKGGDYPFSFNSCAKAAGYDPDELRELLVQFRHSEFEKV